MISSTNSMPIGWLSIIRLVSGNEFGQIFVTDTNRKYLDTILESMQNDFALFKVDNGNVEPLKDSEDAKDE
jgi:DNA replication and repair protein RecF